MSLLAWLLVVSAAVVVMNVAGLVPRLRDMESAGRRGAIGSVAVRTVLDVTVACAVAALFYAMLH